MTLDPEEYVNNNEEVLIRILKHSQNEFPRALALAALVEYGDDPTIKTVLTELEQLKERQSEDSTSESEPR